jgi:hypothetical protein
MADRHLCQALYLKDKEVVPKSDCPIGQRPSSWNKPRGSPRDYQKNGGPELKIGGSPAPAALDSDSAKFGTYSILAQFRFPLHPYEDCDIRHEC